MRIAVIADIHGNATALQAVLDDLHQQGPLDQIILAGDYFYKGPQPATVLQMIQQLHCTAVLGNVDRDMLIYLPPNHNKYALMQWTRQQVGEAGLDFLRRLPFSQIIYPERGPAVMVVHANPLNLDDKLLPESNEAKEQRLLGNVPAEVGVVVFGHHHVAFQRRFRQLLLVDAGSCGLPRDGDMRASYAILEQQKNGSWEARHRRVPYDIQAVIRQFRESNIPHIEKRIRTLLDSHYEKTGGLSR